MSKEVIDRASEIIAEKAANKNEGGCVLALIDHEGYPTASTLTVSKSDGIKYITFCTGLGSNKANRIRNCNKASVCFNAEDENLYNITLVGTIEVLTDPETRREMWYDGLKGHFTGSDDPNYCVLRFETKRYNLFVDWKEAVGTL